jgi:competence ComEA-like helix-hairpin-helix protein
MHGSATQAALGCIVAALAVAALAAQRRDSAPPDRPPVLQPAAAMREVRALRDGQRLDLNRASAEELALIPGIGPKLADRIVLERSRRGGFARVEDLQEVRGVGPKTWRRIQPFVALRAGDQNRSIRYDADRPALK